METNPNQNSRSSLSNLNIPLLEQKIEYSNKILFLEDSLTKYVIFLNHSIETAIRQSLVSKITKHSGVFF